MCYVTNKCFYKVQLDPIYGVTSIFVLCDNEDNRYEPIGTTFAVSTRYLLTAQHNLESSMQQEHYTIASTIVRNGRNDYFKVRVVAVNKRMDWAILELMETHLITLVPIPISLFDPIQRETRLKIYHCPVILYNNLDEDIVTSSGRWVTFYAATNHHIITSNGLYSGSSGAPVILDTGEVVAIHCEMYNQGVLVDTEQVQITETLSQGNIQSAINLLSETSNSNVQVSGAHLRALKISRCKKLVQMLRNLGVM
jgi:hypothetical protein